VFGGYVGVTYVDDVVNDSEMLLLRPADAARFHSYEYREIVMIHIIINKITEQQPFVTASDYVTEAKKPSSRHEKRTMVLKRSNFRFSFTRRGLTRVDLPQVM
jgi:hypothetical protein